MPRFSPFFVWSVSIAALHGRDGPSVRAPVFLLYCNLLGPSFLNSLFWMVHGTAHTPHLTFSRGYLFRMRKIRFMNQQGKGEASL
jgi:hypothetical protein